MSRKSDGKGLEPLLHPTRSTWLRGHLSGIYGNQICNACTTFGVRPSATYKIKHSAHWSGNYTPCRAP